MTHPGFQPQPAAPSPKKKPKTGLIVALCLLALGLLCACGGVFLSHSSDDGSPRASDSTVAPLVADKAGKASASPKQTVAKKPVVRIKGDDLVKVGTDVPAGTYRATTEVDGLCYWSKTRDAEGQQIIANGIPSGGRPQVTLKSGVWFNSQGCPDWSKQR